MLAEAAHKLFYRFALPALHLLRADHLIRPLFGGIGTILMLHRVVRPDQPYLCGGITTTTDFLDTMLRLVRAGGYDIVSLDEMHRRLTLERRPGRFVCFTFDDGYADNNRLALPIFRRHQAPMAVYVTTGMLDRRINYWWRALEQVILENDRVVVPGPRGAIAFSTPTMPEKRRAHAALSALAHRDLIGFQPVLQAMFERYRVDPAALADRDALTWPELKDLATDPLVEIGAHTVSHPPLSQLDADRARREMGDSKARLEAFLGREVGHFAYPFGTRNECGAREAALARELGFRTATTTRNGNLFPEHRDCLWLLPRIGCHGDFETAAFLKMQMSGFISAVKNRGSLKPVTL